MEDYSQLHSQLTSLRQWVVRRGKQPIGFNPKTNKPDPTEWQNPDRWMTFEQALERSKNYDGIGFIVARNSDGLSVVGGDLDCCRNPRTGTLSAWAISIIEEIKPFYTEPSISGTGIRFFALGHLPNNENKIDGHGSDDLLNEDREAILAAKPKAVFNGFELYEDARHLTITGKKIAEYCFEPEDRTEAIEEAAIPFLAAKATKDMKAGNGKLPQIDILDVIDTSSFFRSGGQLLGPHPTEGSTTGKNLVVDPAKNVYCWMHDGINAGGDAWIWLACECGAVRWEDAGQGALKDRSVLEKTLEHAIARGLVTADQVKSNNKKTVEELIKTILSDPRNLKNPDVIQVLAALKANDPVEYDIVLDSIKKAGIGIKVDTINRIVDNHVGDNKQKNEEREKSSEDDIRTALDILKNGDPIAAHMKYVNRKIRGREKPARAVTMSAYSTYMSPDDRLHADAVGSSQSGKTATVISTLETFPEENVIVASEASPKSLYYLARENPERLKNAIVYIDDGRPEHIPVLKTFRNEGNVTPRNMSVIDGEFMELTVQYRPVVMSSSVTPLRDMEQQATSRNFLIPIPDATDKEEEDIRTTIRKQARAGAVLSNGDDDERRILQTMARILRDDSVKDVLIPFDVVEPQGADRRGTGQFMRFIKISAFINQFQRPILEFTDGRKFVLATYDDFVVAANVWFDFAEGQEFKISTAALAVLKALPDEWPGRSAPNLVKIVGKSQRTIERYLEDLYESGVANRERISAPGMPWGYWCEHETRQRILSRISDTADVPGNSDRITTKNPCRKYLGEKSSDSLIDSSKEFFNNNDIVKKEMYRSITYRQRTLVGDFGEIYLSLSNFPGIHVVIRKMRRMIANISDKTFLARFDRIRQIAFRFCRDYCREYENPTSPSGIPDKSAHGSDSIQTEVEEAQRQLEETEAHYSKRAKKYKIGSYREMVALVPYDKSSPEAEKICRAFRGQLTKGMAPRLEFLAKDTDLPKEPIESYLNNAPWVRKDVSQGGIAVYLPKV